ncbi:MAG: indole-3-glycerol phosphate synthase TrpC [Candidatus Zixiibacteriota bacterium]
MADARHTTIPAVLRDIVAAAQRRAQSLHQTSSFGELESKGRRRQKRPFALALEKCRPAIIAEVKKASPSKGVFRSDFDPIRLAASYQDGGAAALSVVTEPEYFQGNTAWIEALRNSCHLPILRKDFLIEPIQVAESAAAGADAILLIARILTSSQLAELTESAKALDLEILFEAHDEADLSKIAGLNPELIGINARNLDDFSVSMDTFEPLRTGIPANAMAIAESGLENYAQIRDLMTTGYRGFLIGESLLKSGDPSTLLRTLRGEG